MRETLHCITGSFVKLGIVALLLTGGATADSIIAYFFPGYGF